MSSSSSSLPVPSSALVDPREAGTLARLMVEARQQMLRFAVEYQKQTPEQARSAWENPDEQTRAYLEGKPAHELSWGDLDQIMEIQGEAAAVARWEQVKQYALDEYRSGHRAGKATAAPGISGPLDRARFFAIRADLMQAWAPVQGIERTLIEQMAQSYTMQIFWQEVATVRSFCEHHESTRGGKKLAETGRWELPRLDRIEAIDHATQMVDRWNRMFLRQLRALRDMRRYSPVVIHNPRQVNVAAQGGQQVNVSATSDEAGGEQL